MAFKVQVGPAQIAIHQGQSVLLTERDGQVNWPSNRALARNLPKLAITRAGPRS